MQTIRGRFSFAAIFSVFAIHSLCAMNPTLLGPQLAGNASGVVAIWSMFNGSEYAIYEAKLPVGGAWSSPLKISASRVSCLYPSIAINSGGDILACWQKAVSPTPDIQLAVNTFADLNATVVTTASFYGAEHIPCSTPVVRIDNDGNGTAVWEGRSSAGYLMLGTECSTTNLRAPIITLSGLNTQPVNPSLVIKTSSGTSFVTWQQAVNQIQTIMAANVTLDGAITGPVPISSTTTACSRSYLAVSSNNHVYAAWWEAASPNTTLKVTSISDDLAVSVDTLSLDSVNLVAPRISVNASDNILLVANANLSNGNTAIATAVKTSGTWSAVSILSDASTTSASSPIVRFNDSGQGAALWQDNTAANGVIWGAIYNSGAWGAPTALSSESNNCGSPALYVAPSGYAIASWVSETSSDAVTTSIQVATLSSFSGSWSAPSTVSSP